MASGITFLGGSCATRDIFLFMSAIFFFSQDRLSLKDSKEGKQYIPGTSLANGCRPFLESCKIDERWL